MKLFLAQAPIKQVYAEDQLEEDGEGGTASKADDKKMQSDERMKNIMGDILDLQNSESVLEGQEFAGPSTKSAAVLAEVVRMLREEVCSLVCSSHGDVAIAM